MKENFDFVSMENYKKDTAELVQASNTISTQLRMELENCKRMLHAIVHAAGKIEVPMKLLVDRDDLRITYFRDEKNDTMIFLEGGISG